MGGQQFGSGNLHLDLCDMNRELSFDRERGILEVEAGIQWPQIIDYLLKTQCDGPDAWGIRQKQTGADRLSIGGALAARSNFACIVVNLHCDHNPRALAKSAHTFRSLIDIALSFGGSFYLTYHRYATKGQLLNAYPQLPHFLDENNRRDEDTVFDSNWYRHLRAVFS